MLDSDSKAVIDYLYLCFKVIKSEKEHKAVTKITPKIITS